MTQSDAKGITITMDTTLLEKGLFYFILSKAPFNKWWYKKY